MTISSGAPSHQATNKKGSKDARPKACGLLSGETSMRLAQRRLNPNARKGSWKYRAIPVAALWNGDK